ncbi:hypothetical protein C8F04DRAFT_1134251 [Mycena alexandri]|uniref:Uncharacterized protein n=1 Tax=Mycena alexandri TaxID=1745969 RepID=A0AAD6WQJ8_9AGAR|nr:hypothetical protein C8F04DRAFT_1134251 [Mycena alexandri]
MHVSGVFAALYCAEIYVRRARIASCCNWSTCGAMLSTFFWISWTCGVIVPIFLWISWTCGVIVPTFLWISWTCATMSPTNFSMETVP